MSSLQSASRELRSGTMLHRKIKCPRHYVLKPGGIPFVMERNPRLKNISEANAKALGLMIWRRKRDADGNWIQNFKDYLQPPISAAEVKLRIYDPNNFICNQCKRCVTA